MLTYTKRIKRQSLYKDINIGFATFGVHGNALFFFVSGYLLAKGLATKQERFDNWYKRRINRLLPALIIWYLGVIDIIGEGNFLLSIWNQYWFINCIIIYYALYYFTVNVIIKRKAKYASGTYLLSIAIAIVWAICMDKSEGSVFHSEWHYICHFSVMILGGLTYRYEHTVTIHRKGTDWLWLICCFAAYFIIMNLGKGHTDWTYYLQLLCIIPLHLFCFYSYKVLTASWCDKIFQTRLTKWPFIVLSSLTLEIYIVQFFVITDQYNNLFPLNLFIVFIIITIVAYILRVISNVFIQLMRQEPWQWKETLELS